MAEICRALAKEALESRARIIFPAMDEAAILFKIENSKGHTRLQDFPDALLSFPLAYSACVGNFQQGPRLWPDRVAKNIGGRAEEDDKALPRPHLPLDLWDPQALSTELEDSLKRTPPH